MFMYRMTRRAQNYQVPFQFADVIIMRLVAYLYRPTFVEHSYIIYGAEETRLPVTYLDYFTSFYAYLLRCFIACCKTVKDNIPLALLVSGALLTISRLRRCGKEKKGKRTREEERWEYDDLRLRIGQANQATNYADRSITCHSLV